MNLIGLGSCLLGLKAWREFDLRHFAGKAVFGMCFRRPLLSILQDSFYFLSDVMKCRKPQLPTAGALDEVIMVVALTALMGTCPLDSKIYCSDASPSGGGAAVPKGSGESQTPKTVTACAGCARETSMKDIFPFPAQCRVAMCSLDCVMAHRQGRCRKAKMCCRLWRKIFREGSTFEGGRNNGGYN